MRYDTPLFFVKSGEKKYDPDSGEWSVSNNTRTKKYANVTHLSAERQQAVFGDVRSDRYVVRLQMVYEKPYDYVEIAGKRYMVDTERCTGDKRSLVVVRNG